MSSLMLLLMLTCPALSSLAPRQATTCPLGADVKKANIMNLHNQARQKCGGSVKGVKDLTWDDTLACSAQIWSQRCKFEHSHTPGVGENIASGSGFGYGIEQSIQQWYDEIWQFRDGMGFTHATGHATQMAWKDTTKVGCGASRCTASQMGLSFGSDSAFFFVCQYSPAGNIGGLPGGFSSQVFLPTDKSQISLSASASTASSSASSTASSGTDVAPALAANTNPSTDGSTGGISTATTDHTSTFTTAASDGTTSGLSLSNLLESSGMGKGLNNTLGGGGLGNGTGTIPDAATASKQDSSSGVESTTSTDPSSTAIMTGSGKFGSSLSLGSLLGGSLNNLLGSIGVGIDDSGGSGLTNLMAGFFKQGATSAETKDQAASASTTGASTTSITSSNLFCGLTGLSNGLSFGLKKSYPNGFGWSFHFKKRSKLGLPPMYCQKSKGVPLSYRRVKS